MGECESIEHPASMTHDTPNANGLLQELKTDLSDLVGIEDASDLIADLSQALEKFSHSLYLI